jgi:hypothetical protein
MKLTVDLGGSQPQSRNYPQSIAFLCCGLIIAASVASVAHATTGVKLNVWTTPDSAVAGVNNVSITGSGFPSETISPANVTISLASSCGGSPAATTTATSVKFIIGNSQRVNFVVPASLAQGTYFASISDSADPIPFVSANCSEVEVTHTNPVLSSCIPASSLGVLDQATPPSVTAYVPNGCWSCSSVGLEVVPLEPALSPPTSISTAGTVNSCAANSSTGEVVCVANNTDVYTIRGTQLKRKLTSASNASTSFSGGSCENCGVAIDALHNKAAISMGLSSSPQPSGSGIQYLDLATHKFASPVATTSRVSEDILIDPIRSLLLSPSEQGSYDLLQITSSGPVDYQNFITGGGQMDSSAEDCSTGLALSSSEDSSNVILADLNQAIFKPNSPNSWTAGKNNVAAKVVTLSGASFSAGTCGISVAQGSSHLAIVTGEFGGNSFAILKLPSKLGSGTPKLVDWAYVSSSVFPNEPDGNVFSAGLDPHTVTTYVSPTTGKAIALMSATPPPNCLALIHMTAVLHASRASDGHTVTSLPSGAISFAWTGQGPNCTKPLP